MLRCWSAGCAIVLKQRQICNVIFVLIFFFRFHFDTFLYSLWHAQNAFVALRPILSLIPATVKVLTPVSTWPPCACVLPRWGLINNSLSRNLAKPNWKLQAALCSSVGKCPRKSCSRPAAGIHFKVRFSLFNIVEASNKRGNKSSGSMRDKDWKKKERDRERDIEYGYISRYSYM